jgi:hypothetical protein
MVVVMVFPKVVVVVSTWFLPGVFWPRVIRPAKSTKHPTNLFWFAEMAAQTKLNKVSTDYGTFN